MKIRSVIATAGVTALLVGGGVANAAEPDRPASLDAADALDPSQATQAITLVTGDTVLLQGGNRFSFIPGEGREGVGYGRTSVTRDGVTDLYVVPRDAGALLASGKLDRRLFNVTALARDGFADAPSLPLIVQYDEKARAEKSLAGAGRTADLDSIDAGAYAVSTEDAVGVWDRLVADDRSGELSYGYKHVWLDGKSKLLLDQSVPQVGGPEAWEAGYTGTGVTIAVLDTGYDPTHPDFQGKVTAAQDFTGTSPGAIDGYGHGTHVASTVAGTGAASNGKYKGVAPDAELIIGKVCTDDGFCEDSSIIAGMQWAADNGAAAANLSIGGGPTDGTDPLSEAVNEISLASGTLFVIAAGNDGSVEGVSSPATADEALAVGSVTKQDTLSGFSSQGPRFGDGAVKPDIAAPGSDIVAARAAGTEGPMPVDDYYFGASGTSMATPHVAGAAALLKQAHPDWTARQLKSALMSSAKGLDGLSIYQLGAGRLDIGRGVVAEVTTDVASLSFGKFAFPHGQPGVSKKLTYTNSSAAEITLALDVAASTTDGTPAPAGLYTVDKSSVTIAPGGSAEVTVTFNPLAGSPAGAYSGVITATGGDEVVRTAAGGVLEPEMHDITLKVKPRAGESVDYLGGFFFNVENGDGDFLGDLDADNELKVRVPPGTYEFMGSIYSDGTTPSAVALATDVTVAHSDVTTLWDATKATRHSVGLADRTDEKFDSDIVSLSAWSHDETAAFHADASIAPGEAAFVVETPLLASKDFWYSEHPLLVSPAGAAQPYRYNLYFETEGKLPKGTVKRIKDSEVVREKAVYHSQGVKASSLRTDFPFAPGAGVMIGAYGVEVAVPSTVLEYFTPGDGIWSWRSDMEIGDIENFDVEASTRSAVRTTPRTVNYNQAPLGPTLVDYGVYRAGDWLSLAIPMYSGPSASLVTHSFWTAGVTGTTTLLKDGVVVDSTQDPCVADFDLPAGLGGTFTLKCETTRNVAWSAIGTKSSGEWTFTSEPSDPDVWTTVGLSAVRFGAAGVADGFAPVAKTQAVTLDVEHSAEVSPGTKSLRFEVSYDEGETWKTVTISRTGDHATATLKHPAGAKSVSTRLTVTDNAGLRSSHTTIKAYGLK
ncbi:S8 family serine peptidase [Phytomonospora sp. NPDC050363]|uniref:S8 family serine peptidase n=1 Tax=Phytomonospora sp. NPDC050363 TaxID=3155642 RepID=UPI0033F14698